MADKDGNKTGGRSKGVKNKTTQELHEIAERLGVNPFEILLLFAAGDSEALGCNVGNKFSQEFAEFLDEDQLKTVRDLEEKILSPITPELRQKAAKDACEYLFPKRKAIEHSGGLITPSSIEDFLRKKDMEVKVEHEKKGNESRKARRKK